MFAGISDLFTGHAEHKGHCWSVHTNNQAAWSAISDSAKAHGVTIEHGDCPNHGKAIHSWEKHGVSVHEYGAGASQIAPFTQLDESVHAFHHERCYNFTGPDAGIADLRKFTTAHKIDVHDGKCKDTVGDCYKWHGLDVCRSGKADATWGSDNQIAPFTQLDTMTEESIHAFHHGRCYDATGPHDALAHLRKAATAHHVDVHDGKCKDAHDCRKWRGLDVCRSGDADAAWGGDKSVHGSLMIGGHNWCIDMTGDAIEDGPTDARLQKSM